jgi:hypothetical protein
MEVQLNFQEQAEARGVFCRREKAYSNSGIILRHGRGVEAGRQLGCKR